LVFFPRGVGWLGGRKECTQTAPGTRVYQTHLVGGKSSTRGEGREGQGWRTGCWKAVSAADSCGLAGQ
jgi:hypothetical protein